MPAVQTSAASVRGPLGAKRALPWTGLFLLGSLWSAPAVRADEPQPPLRVVTAGSKPFVHNARKKPVGLSIEVFERLAHRVGLHYVFVPTKTVSGALDMVRRGEADIAVGPISMTAERREKLSFTVPYFRSRMGILAHEDSSVLWGRIKPFLTTAFFLGVTFLLSVLLVVGTLVWVAERRQNADQFPASALAGITSGVWLALVTMTTVGYGDKAPVTVVGRIIVGLWMVLSMLTASSLTASIATALTLAQISPGEIRDFAALRRRRTAVVQGTTSRDLAESYGARLLETQTVEEALKLVEEKKAAAMVFDLPVLQHHLHENPSWPFALVESNVQAQNYGFALKTNHPLLTDIDVALLEMGQEGELRSIEDHWLAKN